jgi:adenylate cyclase
MRIGVHTCVAIVGNLGAADRFQYTAMGDGVNLASRLEGVNKLFGTGILMSADTARAQDPEAPLREVGRVVVKGKTEPVDIFTLDDDAGLRTLTRQALEAYRARDWDGALRFLAGIEAMRPGDGVARHYVEMVAALRAGPPPGPEWDGAESLDKM